MCTADLSSRIDECGQMCYKYSVTVSKRFGFSGGHSLNKQRFLTELQRLLIFMTDADRKLTISEYSARFDEAGEEGEAALLEQLGSPTKLAISLSRGYEPGRLSAETKQREALKKAEAAAEAARLEHLSNDGYTPGDEPVGDPVSIMMRSLDEPCEEEDKPAEEEPLPVQFRFTPDDEYDEDEDEEIDSAPRYVRAASPLPAGVGAALLALILLIVGVPLALLTLGVALIWLIPGAVGLGATLLCAIAALWCLGFIADALLIFGLAFIVLAVGLLLLWCGIWLDVRLIGLFVRGVQRLCDKLLGKKVLA